jgi:uncharacterized protein with NAD-binding domain and iron-sulfur cluster
MLSGSLTSSVSRTSRGGLASSSNQRYSSKPFTTHRVRLTTCAAAASSSKVPAEADVVVVGAGLAGLNAAAVLRKRGLSPVILEAGDAVGGRTRTDNVDGFLLDRGFQIFLTGYPEARETLDYEALQLQPFYAGAHFTCSCLPSESNGLPRSMIPLILHTSVAQHLSHLLRSLTRRLFDSKQVYDFQQLPHTWMKQAVATGITAGAHSIGQLHKSHQQQKPC